MFGVSARWCCKLEVRGVRIDSRYSAGNWARFSTIRMIYTVEPGRHSSMVRCLAENAIYLASGASPYIALKSSCSFVFIVGGWVFDCQEPCTSKP